MQNKVETPEIIAILIVFLVWLSSWIYFFLYNIEKKIILWFYFAIGHDEKWNGDGAPKVESAACWRYPKTQTERIKTEEYPEQVTCPDSVYETESGICTEWKLLLIDW